MFDEEILAKKVTIPKFKPTLKIEKPLSIKQPIVECSLPSPLSHKKEKELRYPVKLKFNEDGTEKINSNFSSKESRTVLLGSLRKTLYELSPELKSKHEMILKNYEILKTHIQSKTLLTQQSNFNSTYNQQEQHVLLNQQHTLMEESSIEEPSILRDSIQQQIINPSSPISYHYIANQIPIVPSTLTPEISVLTCNTHTTTNTYPNVKNVYHQLLPSPPMDPTIRGPSPPPVPSLPQNISELTKMNWLDPFSGINFYINKTNI